MKDGGVQHLVWLFPLAVKITPDQRAPIVSINDTIRIEHRDNSNDKMFSKLFTLLTHKHFNQPIQHMRSLWLARVHSAGNENALFGPMVLQILVQTVPKVSELRACLQKMVFIVLEKLFNFFFKRSFEQPLNPSFGVFALPCQFLRFLKLLSKLLFDYVWYLVHQPHLFIVVHVGFDVVCYGHQGHRTFAQSVTQDVHLHKIGVLFIVSNLFEALLHLGIGVWDGVCKPDFLVLVSFELIGEAECVIEFNSFASIVVVQQKLVLKTFDVLGRTHFIFEPGDTVSFVLDILSASEPASPVLFMFSFGPNTRLHAVRVETRGFGQVQNVKCNFLRFLLLRKHNVLVNYFEVVPLSVPLSIQVIFQP